MSNSHKFEKAVEFAQNRLNAGFEKSNYGHSFGISDVRMGLIGIEPSSFQEKYLEDLIEAAEHEPGPRRWLRFGLAKAIEEEMELPQRANDWLVRFLKDDLGKIEEIRGAPRTDGKYILIYHTVEDIVDEFGMKPTRGEKSVPTSAIDAVAVALKRLGIGPNSYDRIRKIWQKKPGIRIYFDE